MKLTSVNPYTNEILSEYEIYSDDKINDLIGKSETRFQEWKKISAGKRTELISNLSGSLKTHREDYARLMALEIGKPITEARSEIDKCAWVCDYYAENSESFLAPEIIQTESTKSYITCCPLGIILGIMPWNFPFWQVFRFAVPTLIAGNAVLLKHSSNICGCSLAIESLFREAGFPENLFTSLLIPAQKVKQIISDKRIRGISLTGSTKAGRDVAEVAGANLKKTVLELGGSDPYIIFPDADLKLSAAACCSSRMINAGQSCIAAKRLIIVAEIFKEFTEEVIRIMKSIKMGDPLDESTQLGPLATLAFRNQLHEQVMESVNRGANCLIGGFIPNGQSAFYPPTILSDVKPGMPAYEEEIFGPVAVLISAENHQEALEIANHTEFGLGAAIFTNDIEKAEDLAATYLEAGCCFVNDFVRSDPRLPFGGIKNSGFGRELSGHGIREFVNLKTISIK